MSWMRGEQYTSLFLLCIRNTCTSQVFIVMPMGVKKITLPLIFLPSLISQPEWQLSRIGEEKERKKYTQEDGTMQVLSKTIIIGIAWLTERDVKATGYLQPSSLVDSWMKSYITAMIFLQIIILSAVHIIYNCHIFIISSSSFHGFITKQFNNLLPVGLLA